MNFEKKKKKKVNENSGKAGFSSNDKHIQRKANTLHSSMYIPN